MAQTLSTFGDSQIGVLLQLQTAATTSRAVAMGRNSAFVALLIVSVAVTGTANNFAARIKAEILGDYNFVTVVPDSFISLAFNIFALALVAARRGIHRAQFRYLFRCSRTWALTGAWKFLLLAGVSDIFNNVTGLAAQPHLTTFMMSLMDQATTPFTVFFSIVLLKTRYNAIEIVSVIVVLCTAVSCVLISSDDNAEDNSQFWAFFAAVTTSFAALSFVLKEITFDGYTKERSASLEADQGFLGIQLEQTRELRDPELHLEAGRGAHRASQDTPVPAESLDVFLVGAIIYFVGLLVSVPIALLNHAAVSSGPAMPALLTGLRMLFEKENALTAYVVYIAVNIAFNVSLIMTTSYGSALLCFLSLKLAVPLTAILSAVPWPVIGSKPLSGTQWIALAVLIFGIAGFRVGTMRREAKQQMSS